MFRGKNRGARCYLAVVYHTGCVAGNAMNDNTIFESRCTAYANVIVNSSHPSLLSSSARFRAHRISDTPRHHQVIIVQRRLHVKTQSLDTYSTATRRCLENSLEENQDSDEYPSALGDTPAAAVCDHVSVSPLGLDDITRVKVTSRPLSVYISQEEKDMGSSLSCLSPTLPEIPPNIPPRTPSLPP